MTNEELIRGEIEHFKSESEELFSPAYVELEDAVQDDPERAWQLILLWTSKGRRKSRVE